VKVIADDLVFVLLLAAAIPTNLYPLFYAFRPWSTTPQGRALMTKAVGNMIVIDVVLATLLFGQDYPGRDLVRVFGFGVFVVGMWYLLVSLLTSPGAVRYPPRSWLSRRRYELTDRDRRGFSDDDVRP
jgi:hypothetical protein